jgi:UDP-N-acetylglucosamine--N-acetylmuramyl-(pentapeptide) pyrophosphoryl-undecaprenol N-acetylglucosamine transferase
MGEAYAAADVVLSRAGATTLAELMALAKPSLLVPYPFAAADEQTKNASDIVAIGAADMIADSELDEPVFMEKLLRLLTDEAYFEQMKNAAHTSGYSNARSELAKMIVGVANKIGR